MTGGWPYRPADRTGGRSLPCCEVTKGRGLGEAGERETREEEEEGGGASTLGGAPHLHIYMDTERLLSDRQKSIRTLDTDQSERRLQGQHPKGLVEGH